MGVLDASDKQSVPNTIRLFRLTVKFGGLDLYQMVEDKTATPVEKIGSVPRQGDLCVRGELLTALLDPIISLSRANFGLKTCME